jgi:general secretion pathway protein F
MQYEIKALRGNEGLTLFSLDAVDVNDASHQAKAQGYTVVGIKSRSSWQAWHKRGKYDFPLVLFSQELLALLDAGLSLVESLEALAEKELRPEIKKTLTEIIARLYEGHPMSFALENSTANFPDLFVATVRASEKTGSLSEVLSRYIVYQSQLDQVRSKVVSALIYPMLLAVIGGLVMLFLLLYVVPRFSRIYADIGTGLPFMSRLLMHWGQLVASHGGQILLVMGLLIVVISYALSSAVCKQWFEKRLWQVPALGNRLRIYQLTRFYRSLGMLLRGGMPVVPALQMVTGLLQLSMREQLAQATEYVRKGRSISQSMDEYGLATPVALRMLCVGERTGQMGEMMERIAAFYEEETARVVERFVKLFEPLLMAFIGVAIGFIVVLMYFPIFELAGNIQ